MIRSTFLRQFAVLVAVVMLAACGNEAPTTDVGSNTGIGDETADETADEVETDPIVESDCPAPDHTSPRRLVFNAAPPMCIDPAETFVAVFDTSEGEVRVTLDTTNTPITANNFVTLARFGYYDGTTWFRTDPSIDIIQGGAPNTESPTDPGPGYTIPDEPAFDDIDGQLIGPYRHEPGQLVMARARGRDSSSAQYFFSTGPKTALLDAQGTYVVFGQTNAAGLAVLQAVMELHEPGGQFGGAPSRTVTIRSVRIENR